MYYISAQTELSNAMDFVLSLTYPLSKHCFIVLTKEKYQTAAMLGLVLHIIWIIIVIMFILWLIELVFGVSFFAFNHDEKREMEDAINLNQMLGAKLNPKSSLQQKSSSLQHKNDINEPNKLINVSTLADEDIETEPSDSDFSLNL